MRSGSLNACVTTAPVPRSASCSAALIACSGAPPPSPMPFAPLGDIGEGDSIQSVRMCGTSAAVTAW
jgi:hypothetical protein